MKRTLLMAGIAMLLTVSPAIAGIVIKTTITIGRKSNDCQGFGLCSISSSSSYTEGAVNSTFDVNEERGSMIICIYESDIQKVQPDKMLYFKNKGSVIFAEDISMTEEINRAIQASKPVLIKKGEYELTYRNGKFYIEIPL
ncbi:MAG: hypothetical protein HGA37_16915 [Lentimicrobium sp.]|nr:hypothetical protein [Lentimicrobium sp.]